MKRFVILVALVGFLGACTEEVKPAVTSDDLPKNPCSGGGSC